MGRRTGNLKQGYYNPKNPEKYIVTESSITGGKGIRYMSSWELRFFEFCDYNKSVVEWASESIVIPYISPKDDRQHKYYPDVFMRVKGNNGVIKNHLVEIKPHAERFPPKKPKRQTQKSMYNYQNAIMTYMVNQAKWKAAEIFCDLNEIEWRVMDEYDLGIKK